MPDLIEGDDPTLPAPQPAPTPAPAPAPKKSVLQRLKDWFKGLFGA